MNKRICRFGIISDTHIRAPDGDRSSPFPVNDKANSRAEYAANLLALQQAEFTVHLGDMVHPLPHMDAYDSACVEAKRIFQPLSHPGKTNDSPQTTDNTESILYVAGNHDIGDKPMPASPASAITSIALQKYEAHFGKIWHRHDHGPITILVINSSLVNTGLEEEKQQRSWLETTLGQLDKETDRRVFLFSHYPPYLHHASEAEHYDNYAEPGRQWLLGLIKSHRIDAVFSGHVHHFFHNRYNDTDLFCLPATSFVRQDYAEMFHTTPGTDSEYGRNDTGKLHVTVVDVYEDGHTLRLLPTFGKEAEDTAEEFPVPNKQAAIVHLRHAWHESVDLPYNGPMEEFSRKRTRNDYTLMRLLQMGLHDVRVPLADLLDSSITSEVSKYHHAGISFHPMVLASSDAATLKLTAEHTKYMASLEYVMTAKESSQGKTNSLLAQLEESTLSMTANSIKSIPVWLGCAKTSSGNVNVEKDGEAVFAHSVTSGFSPLESENVIEAILKFRSISNQSNLVGAIFQVPWHEDLKVSFDLVQSACKSASSQSTESEISAQMLIRFAPSNPATTNYDDNAIKERAVQALKLANLYPNLTVQFDTFVDVDRGYSPRHGFIDRHFNLREIGLHLLRTKSNPRR